MKKFYSIKSYTFLLSLLCSILICKSYYEDYKTTLLEINLLHKIHENDIADAIVLNNTLSLGIILESIQEQGKLNSVSFSSKDTDCRLFCKYNQISPTDDSLGFIKYDYASKLFLSNIFSIILIALSYFLVFRLLRLNKENLDTILEKNILKERERISKQVFHDITSPLTSLELLLESIRSLLPEKKRIAFREITTRIQDIINSLNYKSTCQIGNDKTPQLLFLLVQNIISEKRLEFKNTQIEFDNYLDYGTFVKVNSSQFSRAISNIINNAIEAKHPSRKVKIKIKVKLTKENDHCLIEVKDNGRGIPQTFLKEATIYGKSFEKKEGSGTGLAQVKNFVDDNNGVLNISSTINTGTEIQIKLKSTPCPKWFKNELTLTHNKICIIDDDDSIHTTWNHLLKGRNLEVVNIKTSQEFKRWINSNKPEDFQFLFDLELIDSTENGFKLIKAFGLEKRSTLVTSHYGDEAVKETCIEMGIKVIPKSFVQFISIRKLDKSKDLFVLIDDDPLIHEMWKMESKRSNSSLNCYLSVEDFVQASSNIPKSATIFIDSNLGNSIKGEIESERLFNFGYSKLFIATGYNQEDIKVPHWIQGVVGKRPSFYN